MTIYTKNIPKYVSLYIHPYIYACIYIHVYSSILYTHVESDTEILQQLSLIAVKATA